MTGEAKLVRIVPEDVSGAIIGSNVFNAMKTRCWIEMENALVSLDTFTSRDQTNVPLVEVVAKNVSTKIPAQAAKLPSNSKMAPVTHAPGHNIMMRPLKNVSHAD
jgi:hypothetical protein